MSPEKPGAAPRGAPPALADYPFVLPIATRWSDNDVYGHVNNVVYYAYFDTVINRYLIERGGLRPLEGDVIGLCVSSECSYAAPSAYPEELAAGLRVRRIGRSSVTYEIGIFGRAEPSLRAYGSFVHVFVGRADRRPRELPAELREALERIAVPPR